MTKKIILLLAITITMASCNNNSKSTTEVKAQMPIEEKTVAPNTLNGEIILKYGHKFSKDCSATSIDWSGDYLGATGNIGNDPARLRLTLNKNWTYKLKVMSLEYLKSGDIKETLQEEHEGTFTFDSAGQIIKLIGTNHPLTNDLISVRVGENSLSVLDGDLKELSKDGDMNTLYK